MSTQASKAARELTYKLFSTTPDKYSEVIQAALADLLKCAENVTHYPESNIGADWKQTFRFLKSALEPWKAGE